MHGVLQHNQKNKKTAKRMLTLGLILCFLFAVLLSEALFFASAGHDHLSDYCPVCAQIHNVEHLLRQLGLAAVFLSFGLLCLFADAVFARTALLMMDNLSPVRLKIQINC